MIPHFQAGFEQSGMHVVGKNKKSEIFNLESSKWNWKEWSW